MQPSQPAAEAAELIDGPRWIHVRFGWVRSVITVAGQPLFRLDVQSEGYRRAVTHAQIETSDGRLIDSRTFASGSEPERDRLAKDWCVSRSLEVTGEAHRALQTLGGLVR